MTKPEFIIRYANTARRIVVFEHYGHLGVAYGVRHEAYQCSHPMHPWDGKVEAGWSWRVEIAGGCTLARLATRQRFVTAIRAHIDNLRLAA